MSRLSRRVMVETLYTIVGFNDKGEEIARVSGLTESELRIEADKYHLSSILESEIVAPKAYCEVENCTRVAIAIMKLRPGGDPIKVCKYHASGLYVKFKPPYPIRDKVMYKGFVLARDWLCVKYCPSYWQRKVDEETICECRAFQEPRDKKERKKREKGYSIYGQNLVVLCIEDPWWRM